MISNQIIPALYLLEIEGEAIQSVISGNFNILKISIASKDFGSDLEANEALQKSIDFILSNEIDVTKITEMKTEYNPEFYPTSEYKISDEQKEQAAEKQEEANELSSQLVSSNKIAFVITKAFDPIGDFVSIRETIVGDNLKIGGKIVLNPSHYVRAKAFNQMLESLVPYTEDKNKDNARLH